MVAIGNNGDLVASVLPLAFARCPRFKESGLAKCGRG
jgi:hypothetical protein